MNLKFLTILAFGMISASCFGQNIQLTAYDFNSRTEENIIFNKLDTIKKTQPHVPNDSALQLENYYSDLRYINSDFSPLFRTRDLFGDVKQFPSSAVVKLIYYIDGQEVSTCTGTLIAEDFIITAAHCTTRGQGKFPDRILVLPLYDNGDSEYLNSLISVEKAYFLSDFNFLEDDDRSNYDMAIYKINTKLGNKLGYIGLDPKQNLPSRIYTFSYPNKTTISYLEAIKEDYTDSLVIEAIDKVIEKNKLKTPDFNRNNQYFYFGNIFKHDINQSYFEGGSPYTIPGESGASRITENFYLVGIYSSWLNDITYSTNNSLLISAFITILLNED